MRNLIIVISIWLGFASSSETASCTKASAKVTTQHPIHRVLILGNSITHSPPVKAIGWVGDWGMAATSEDKDYTHLLMKDIKSKNPDVTFLYSHAGMYEKKYWQIDTSYMSKFRAFNADMIILRFGENMVDSLAEKKKLNVHLLELVNYLSPNKKVIVCLTSSFWPKKNVDRIAEETCAANNWTFVSMAGLYSDSTNSSHNRYSNRAVGNHPSDKGMASIEARIWEKIKIFFN